MAPQLMERAPIDWNEEARAWELEALEQQVRNEVRRALCRVGGPDGGRECRAHEAAVERIVEALRPTLYELAASRQ